MRIIIQQSNGEGPNAVGVETHRALEALRAAHIDVTGGGVLGVNGNAVGAVILADAADAARALETLARAGFKASASKLLPLIA
jgi:hypothetical protein